jgi:hypothetical protein
MATIFQTTGVGISGNAPSYLIHLSADSAGKPGTTTWTVVSDEKLKRNIRPVEENALEIFEKLLPKWIRYQYNGLCNLPKDEGIGITAQELREVVPEAVGSVEMELFPRPMSTDPAEELPRIQVEGFETTNEKSKILDINYHAVIIQAFRAIGELSRKVKQLEAKLAAA